MTVYNEGISQKEKKQTVAERTLIDTARIADLSQTDAEMIVSALQKRGFVKSAVTAGSKADRDFCEFLTWFWNYDERLT
ncbi:MAG: hypothetical protein Ta2A_11500 [Treponemataceae bacterium]|nr:MAG: hypothetical protein Ta2A_11500 [Treponemataceae bacterium]